MRIKIDKVHPDHREIIGDKETLYNLKIFYEDVLQKKFNPVNLGFKDEGDRFRFRSGFGYDEKFDLFADGKFQLYTREKAFWTFFSYETYLNYFDKNYKSSANEIPTERRKQELKDYSLNRIHEIKKESEILKELPFFKGYKSLEEINDKKAKAKYEYETENLDIKINKEITLKNKSSINLKYENFKLEVLEKFKEADLPEYLANPVTNFLNSEEFKKTTNDLVLENVKNSNITNEEIKGRYDIKDKLPNFKIFTNTGMAFSSDESDKEFIEEYAQRELTEIIGLDKINTKDVRSFETYSNKGLISIYFENNGELQRYYNYDDFTKTAVEEVKNENLTKEYEKYVQLVKMDILNSCEHTINKEYINNEKLEKLENKYNSKIEIYQSNIEKSNIEIESLNIKKNIFMEEYQNYINSKNENTNEKDREREF